ncbi:protein of unknown function [Alkalithermobacter thermoalcaliphilus JW-YL-7 = DSM 7308]|uniref:DUF4391 domain-containing protein n=1 Tax=Alkalithermobacter thermoalcaliphilus JW-YL-7 = DSM 7308 TaxID=1121328 RepID=A0A150FRE9_CLOPD|nr:Protein of unknown function DUF4391 [[Clostridium] paradoxum JW-YL-7 = DSM 7308]SHK43560.1 protein of unknown function [[Clostridium] paradoxum JW-YL-7 = DSM 7308]
MDDYNFLNIPDSCFIGSTIYKKLFYENANLSTTDKSLFTDTINKIIWLYCLKPETINIPAYKDEVREYPEIEVIEVILNKEYGLNRIAEIIMRTIPYPMLLIFKLEDKIQFYVAHQRINQSDSSRNTIDELVFTDWLESKSVLFNKLDIKKMRFTNLYTLYSDIVDAISIFNLSSIMPTDNNITGKEAREIAAKIEEIEQKTISLRSKLKKETQFNRKMELNIEIKRLEQNKNKLLGGDKE